MCHLALEKILKAIAAEAKGHTPPRTHDLLYLVNLGGVHPSPEHLDFLGKINNASIPTRYPEDLAPTMSAYPREIAESYLEKTREVAGWLKRDPRLGRS